MDKRAFEYIRTDLALEAAEVFKKQNKHLEGVEISEDYDVDNDILITVVDVMDETGADQIGKPVGKYITLETPKLSEPDEGYHKEITEILIKQLEILFPDLGNKKILVAGIGNREITPDALGPLVVEHLFITRHLIETYGQKSDIVKGLGNISAIAPGVMAQTGMDGREILRGIIDHTKPEVVIIIDALAARSTNRLNRTIQLTNTGIIPGAGVGNHRNELTEATLGVPVIAIGIPTVIDAATIASDTMSRMLEILEREDNPDEAYEMFSQMHEATKSFDQHEKYLLMKELIEPMMTEMFVTPKDIDETVARISFTVSEAINSLCHHI